jgi:hypothetical protein
MVGDMRLLFIESLSDRLFFFIEFFNEHDVTITESSKGAINCLKSNIYDIIFLGGDLGNGYGSDVAEWLSNNKDNENNNSIIVIHTWHSVEIDFIREYLPQALIMPFNESIYSTIDI